MALQRTIGNGATTELLRARQPASGLLQRELRGKEGVVSGKRSAPLDEQRGRQILEEFSRNDPTSMLNHTVYGLGLGGMQPGSNIYGVWRLEAQEWGLIRENATGEVHLIRGEPTGVEWGPYINEGVPIAHSHPWHPWRAIGQPRGIGALFTNREAGPKVLPTISDFVFPARRGQREHTVYTPYVIDAASGDVRNPGPGDTDRLVWKLSDIQLNERGPDQDHWVSGTLSATSGGTQVWTRHVWAPLWVRRGAQLEDNSHGVDYRFLEPARVASML